MLKVWTASTNAKAVNAVFEPVLSGSAVPHEFHATAKGLPEMGPGDVLLAMGAKSLEALQELGIVPKKAKLGGLREQLIALPTGGHVLVTYDPGIVAMDPAREPDILWDIRLACRQVMSGKIAPKTGVYEYVESFNDVVATIRERFQESEQAVDLALDLETIGLDPFAPGVRIVSLSLTVEAGKSQVVYLDETGQLDPEVLAQLKLLVSSPKVKLCGANLKFDMLWMSVHWGVTVTNFKFDTTLVGNLLNENRSNSLNLHAKLYTSMGGYDDEFNRKYDKSQMHLVPKADLLQYAGGDTDACYRVKQVLRTQLLQDRELANFYVKLLHPSAIAFAKMEERGVLVDLNRYMELKTEVTKEVARLEKGVFELMPNRIKLKYSDNLKLTRDVILREFLFTERGLNLTPQMFTAGGKEGKGPKLPSCTIEHLEMFEDNPVAKEFVGLMREYNSATKTLSTFIGDVVGSEKPGGFLSHLRADGRFHPTYMLHKGDFGGDDAGTVTGRTSAKDPAYQTIPKHTKWAKALRTVYVPPPGYAILKLDYSQGELRVAACVANEPTMIAAYRKGIDLHAITAARLLEMDMEEFLALPKEQQKEARSGGKAGNFGLLYGMSAEGFMAYARKQYGVYLSMEKAHWFRDQFFELYAGLGTWHETYKELAHKQGFIRSPLGRIRHLPLINGRNRELAAKQERQAINSPIQSTLSDLSQLALAHLHMQYPDLWAFGMTHDELQFYVPQDEVEMWAYRIRDVMQNLPLHEFGWQPQLQFLADAEYSLKNLGECDDLKLAA